MKMREVTVWLSGFWVILILFGAAGCGGRAFPPRERGSAALESAPSPSPAPVPVATAAVLAVPSGVPEEIDPAKLGLRLAVEGAPQVSSESAERFDVSGKQLRYAGVVLLPSPRKGGAWPLFSWPENPWGSPIRDAHYDYEVWDALGRRIEFQERLTASFDRATRRWSIPLSRVFQGREQDADASAEQRLLLDLLLADGRRVELVILFRAVGPVPALAQRTIPRAHEQLRASADWGEELRLTGKPLWVHEVSNPYRRELALWVRSPGGTLTYRAQLAAVFWQEHGSSPPTPVPGSYWTEGKVEVAELSIEQASQPERRLPISALAQWTRIPLPPGASVRLSWIGRAPSTQPFCRFVPQAPLRIEWTRWVRQRCGRGGECGDPQEAVQEVASVSETWQLEGVQLSGRIPTELWVADPFLSLKDMVGAASNQDPIVASRAQALLESPFQDLQAKVGSDSVTVTPRIGQPFACQGIFH